MDKLHGLTLKCRANTRVCFGIVDPRYRYRHLNWFGFACFDSGRFVSGLRVALRSQQLQFAEQTRMWVAQQTSLEEARNARKTLKREVRTHPDTDTDKAHLTLLLTIATDFLRGRSQSH